MDPKRSGAEQWRHHGETVSSCLQTMFISLSLCLQSDFSLSAHEVLPVSISRPRVAVLPPPPPISSSQHSSWSCLLKTYQQSNFLFLCEFWCLPTRHRLGTRPTWSNTSLLFPPVFLPRRSSSSPPVIYDELLRQFPAVDGRKASGETWCFILGVPTCLFGNSLWTWFFFIFDLVHENQCCGFFSLMCRNPLTCL